MAVGAIIIFTGADGRRQLMLAGFTGGTMTLLVRFLATGTDPARITIAQILLFPILVLATWAALFIVGRLRS
jgi:hypothetical protein